MTEDRISGIVRAGRGVAWGAVAVAVTLLLAYLARRDAQTVAATETRAEIGKLHAEVIDLRLTVDRLNAYALANYRWTIQVAGKMGWPDPPEPKFFLPQNNYGNGISLFPPFIGELNEDQQEVANASAVAERRNYGCWSTEQCSSSCPCASDEQILPASAGIPGGDPTERGWNQPCDQRN